jgi:hypothetical protein
LSSPSFNEKTTAGLEGGGGDGLDCELYLFILDSRQLKAAVGSNDLFISCHVLGSVDAMLRFIHAVGLLKLAVLVLYKLISNICIFEVTARPPL